MVYWLFMVHSFSLLSETSSFLPRVPVFSLERTMIRSLISLWASLVASRVAPPPAPYPRLPSPPSLSNSSSTVLACSSPFIPWLGWPPHFFFFSSCFLCCCWQSLRTKQRTGLLMELSLGASWGVKGHWAQVISTLEGLAEFREWPFRACLTSG